MRDAKKKRLGDLVGLLLRGHSIPRMTSPDRREILVGKSVGI